MEEEKKWDIIIGATMRSIISQANELKIKKEEVVHIIESQGYYYLIYYK